MSVHKSAKHPPCRRSISSLHPSIPPPHCNPTSSSTTSRAHNHRPLLGRQIRPPPPCLFPSELQIAQKPPPTSGGVRRASHPFPSNSPWQGSTQPRPPRLLHQGHTHPPGPNRQSSASSRPQRGLICCVALLPPVRAAGCAPGRPSGCLPISPPFCGSGVAAGNWRGKFSVELTSRRGYAHLSISTNNVQGPRQQDGRRKKSSRTLSQTMTHGE